MGRITFCFYSILGIQFPSLRDNDKIRPPLYTPQDEGYADAIYEAAEHGEASFDFDMYETPATTLTKDHDVAKASKMKHSETPNPKTSKMKDHESKTKDNKKSEVKKVTKHEGAKLRKKAIEAEPIKKPPDPTDPTYCYTKTIERLGNLKTQDESEGANETNEIFEPRHYQNLPFSTSVKKKQAEVAAKEGPVEKEGTLFKNQPVVSLINVSCNLSK